MATVLAVGNILKFSVWCVDGGQAAVNAYYFNVVAVTGSPATDQDAGDVFINNISASIKAIINANASFNGVVTQRVFPLPLTADVFSVTGAGVGTGGSPALPKQCSGLVSWYTALAGRAKRGRSYIPFPSSTMDTGDGVPTAGYVTLLGTHSTAVNTSTAVSVGGRGATLGQVLFHRATNTFDVITSKLPRAQWATQRRRGAYGRPNSSPV
jgi:hypothetical protein